jgi:hypothetical protein
MTKPDTLCMAPWTHTYLSPQTERRLCCASREPAQNFEQYIDTAAGTGRYIPVTLEQHWNSEHMRSVRRRMMAGETLPECDVCNSKLLNTDVYRSYFWGLFGHKYNEAMQATTPDGFTTMKPLSGESGADKIGNLVLGINPQYIITEGFNVGIDGSLILNNSQHMAFHTGESISKGDLQVNNFQKMIYNICLTLTYSFGELR